MPEKSGYFFRGEAVHLVNVRSRSTAYFNCCRCGERKHEGQFIPLPVILNSAGTNPHRMNIALHPHCRICREQSKGKWARHPLYSPAVEKRMTVLYRSAKAGSSTRGIVFAVDKDDLIEIYIAQNGKCALTGLEFDLSSKGYSGRSGRATLAPSLDRIDSSGNYVVGNIQIVAHAVNIMKNDLKQDQFIKICQIVTEHNFAKSLQTEVA